MANLPVNIAIVSRIIFKPVSAGQMAFNWWFLIFHGFCLTSVLGACATFDTVLHSIHHQIPSLQLQMKKNLLPYKFKFMTLHENLTMGPKIGITIGPGPVISNAVLFEVWMFATLKMIDFDSDKIIFRL